MTLSLLILLAVPLLDWPAPVAPMWQVQAAVASVPPPTTITNQAPLNPWPPIMTGVARFKDHATIQWTYQGAQQPDMFQIMRRVNGKTDQATVLVAHKRVTGCTGSLCTYEWTDKKLVVGQTYTYTGIAIFEGDGGTSLESNSITIAP